MHPVQPAQGGCARHAAMIQMLLSALILDVSHGAGLVGSAAGLEYACSKLSEKQCRAEKACAWMYVAARGLPSSHGPLPPFVHPEPRTCARRPQAAEHARAHARTHQPTHPHTHPHRHALD